MTDIPRAIICKAGQSHAGACSSHQLDVLKHKVLPAIRSPLCFVRRLIFALFKTSVLSHHGPLDKNMALRTWMQRALLAVLFYISAFVYFALGQKPLLLSAREKRSTPFFFFLLV